MGLFGLFKKYDLSAIKPEETAREFDKFKMLEKERMRRLQNFLDEKAGLKLHAKRGRLTMDDLGQLSGRLEDLELDIARTESELNDIRKEKQGLGGILKLQAQRDRLEKSGFWDTVNKMDPAKLEEGLRKYGALNKQTADTIDKLHEILGIPNTRRDTQAAWTPRRHQIFEDLKRESKGKFDQA